MALVKWQGREWDPFRELRALQRDIDNLFNASWEGLADKLSHEATWIPSLDVSEDKDNIVIKADLPGVKQSDIDVSVADNLLTIKGERKQEQEVKDKKLHRVERFYGVFSRSLTLPEFVDTTKISATYNDGVLEIVMPKTEKAKIRQIKVDVK